MKNTIAKIGKYTNTKGGHIHTILPKNTIVKIGKYTNTKGEQIYTILPKNNNC